VEDLAIEARFEPVIELGNHVPFQMLARFGAHVERRDEEPPILEAIREVRDVCGFELEEELPDAPSLRSRLTRDPSAFTRSPRDCGLTAFGSFATLLLRIA
jgi:hypothetical protein